jgi:hypothetical protein
MPCGLNAGSAVTGAILTSFSADLPSIERRQPKKSGVPKALQRTAAAAEQFQIIPTMPSGTLSPVFLSQEECVAVVDELTPPMRGNFLWYSMAFEASYSINPMRRDAAAQ